MTIKAKKSAEKMEVVKTGSVTLATSPAIKTMKGKRKKDLQEAFVERKKVKVQEGATKKEVEKSPKGKKVLKAKKDPGLTAEKVVSAPKELKKKKTKSNQDESPELKKKKKKVVTEENGVEKVNKKKNLVKSSSSSASPKKARLQKKIEDKQEDLKANGKDSNSSSSKPKTEEEKKEERKKQKQLREDRQKKSKTEDVFQLGIEAKKIWEKARREDCDPKEREQLIAKLYSSVSGKLAKVVYAHDTVRVLESLVSLGGDEVRSGMIKEVGDDLVAMSKSKYGHYFVEKLFKYCSKEQRATMFKKFEGKVSEIMKHKIAGEVVESFYNEHASAVQRNRMLQEFCGPEFKIFKEDDVRTVKELIARHPEKERDIVRHVAANVNTLVTKGCYNHSLVHTVIYNYLQVCPPADLPEAVSNLRDVCLHILHSHDGARASMICLSSGTAKDRKSVIKTFKSFVKKICTDEHGYLVMLALFDSVDDTKLVSKAVLAELSASLDEIMQSDHGRKVVMHLMSPRDKTYFYPDLIALLQSGDERNAHSKKDAKVRAAELREEVSQSVCDHVAENLEGMLSDNKSTVFLACVLNHASPKRVRPLLEGLAKTVAKSDFEKPGNLVENTATHMMLKKLIAHDKVREEFAFSSLVLDAMDDEGDVIEGWVKCNRGAFLLVCMVETGVEEIRRKVEGKVGKVAKLLEKQKTPGAMLLKKKLAE